MPIPTTIQRMRTCRSPRAARRANGLSPTSTCGRRRTRWLAGPTPTPLDLGLVAYLGVFQLGLAYLCFTIGLRGTPAVEASLLVLLEPVLNPVWTYLFAGERPGPWAMAGGALVLVATLWRTLQPWWLERRARSAA